MGEPAPGVTPLDPDTGEPIPNSTVGGPEAEATQQQIAALRHEQSQLAAQNHAMEQRLLIAQGDTYQGRPNPGWGIDSLGDLVNTGLNAIDAGRETTITQIGDQAVQYLLTGEMPPDLAVLSGSVLQEGLGGPLAGALVPGVGPNPDASHVDMTFLVGYIEANPDKRDEMLEVYYTGYDVPTVDTDGDGVPDTGDGNIDYVGGRAVWEWYAAEMGTVKSILSQIALDPLNATIIAGGASGVLRTAAGAATLAGKGARTVSLLNKAATALEWVSRIDDPIWWTISGPKAAAVGIGKKIGFLKEAGSETVRRGDTAAANAAQAGDPAAFIAAVTTPADQVPVHSPVVIGGQTYQQVGNSGATFIQQNADGTFTVVTRNENGALIRGDSYGTQQEAVTAATESEQAMIGALYLSGSESQARAYDSAVPTVYRDNEAIIGQNGEYRVVRNQDGTFSVQVWDGTKYISTPGNFTDGQTAVQAAQQDYLQASGSMTTGGGVQVGSARPGAQWTGPGRFGPQMGPMGPGGAGGPGSPTGPMGPSTPTAPPPAPIAISKGQPATTNGGVEMTPTPIQAGGGSWYGTFADGTQFQVLGNADGTYTVFHAGSNNRTNRLTSAQLGQYLDQQNTARGGVSPITPPTGSGQGQIGLPGTGAATQPSATGAASAVSPTGSVTQTPTGAPIDPALNVRPADLDQNATVQRDQLTYDYMGTLDMDGEQGYAWQVTTEDGYIYQVGVTPQSDGELRVMYTGQRFMPDGSVQAVGEEQMLNVSGVTTLDSTAPLIESHAANVVRPAGNAPLGGVSDTPPSGAGVVPTEGASDVGGGATPSTQPSGTGIFPQEAATDSTVSPPMGEGPIGGTPQTPAQTAGDIADTGAATVATDGVPATAADVTVKSPELPERSVDPSSLTKQGDVTTANAPARIADGSRVMADEAAEVIPASAAPAPAGAAPQANAVPASAAPSPGQTSPGGAAGGAPQTGMYGRPLAPQGGGAPVIDYAPSELWIQSAVRNVESLIGDPETSRQIVRDFIRSNPRIRAAAGEFADALRAGDEVDQALASMELQATLAEEWVHTGMARTYDPVAPQISQAAVPVEGARNFPGEWPKTGRAVERLAYGNSAQHDVANLARSGFLPGREMEMAAMVRSGVLDRYTASTIIDGKRQHFILPDGITRLYGDQLAAMPQAQREQLANDILNRAAGFGQRPGTAQKRIEDINRRLNAALSGNPERGPVSGAVDSPNPRPSAPTAPDADTKATKANAAAMTPAQQRIKPGTKGPAYITHSWKNSVGLDEFGNSVTRRLDEAEELYGSPGIYQGMDPAARYDVVEVTTPTGGKFYTMADSDGMFYGFGKTKKALYQNAAEARRDVPLLRIFDEDKLVVAAARYKDPNTLYTRMIGSGRNGLQPAAVRVVADSDGQFHLITETVDGKRLEVFNTYDSVHDARTDLERAIQAGGGLDWSFFGPDGGPLFTGRGLGGANANIPIETRKIRNLVSSLNPYAGVKKAGVTPKNDGTLAGRLFDGGHIDEDQYKTLLATYKKADGTEVVVQEEIIARMMKTGNLRRAFNEVLDEYSASFAPARKVGPDGKAVRMPGKSPVAQGAGWFSEAARESALFGMHRTIPAITGELLSNTYNSIISGHGLSNLRHVFSVREMKQVRRALIGQIEMSDLNDTLRLFQKAERNGVTIRAEDIVDASKFDLATQGDMSFSRAMQRIGIPRGFANVATAPFQFKFNRTGRQLNDVAYRLGIGEAEYDALLYKARVNMVDPVRQEAIRLGEDPDAWRRLLIGLGDDINADNLRQAFKNNSFINRAWQQQKKMIGDGVMEAERKFAFIGGRTKLDDALSKGIFFHYWNSRAVAMHAEIAAKNPLLINLYVDAYEEAQEQAEQLNLPSYLRTWFRFAGSPEGWMGFFNPAGLLVPMFMLAEMGLGTQSDFDVPVVDQILNLGAFTPWILAAVTVLGQTTQMRDLTYTVGTRNMIRAFVNWARAEGIGPLDKFMSPVGDPLDSLQDDALNWLSKNIGEKYFGGQEVEQTDPRATDLRMLNLMVDEKMTELYGPDWREDPALVAMANQAKAAMESGEGHNSVSASVYMQWVHDKADQAIVRSLMPGWAAYQYGPNLEQRAQVDEIFDKLDRGEEISDEEQAVLDAYFDNGTTADARNLNSQLDGYYDIGTTFQRELAQTRTMLLYDEAPEGSWVQINENEYYSAEEWNAMSTDERREAVWRWVAAQGGTDQLNAYYDAQEEYRTEHPEVGEYLAWRDAFREDPVAIHNEMMRISPGYANYINGLDDPTDQDRWFTVEAYYASLGEQYGLNDNPDDPLNPSQANPMQVITGYQTPTPEQPYQPREEDEDEERETFGSGEWSSEREWRENAPGEYVAAMQDEYEQQITDVQPIVDDVLEQGGWGWMVGMTYAEIEAQSQARGTSRQYDDALKAIKNQFYFMDISTPTVDMEVRDYNRWVEQQQAVDPNADVSPQAYEAAKFERQNAYGVGPQNDPEEQQYQEQQRIEAQNAGLAQWWANNPNAEPFRPGGPFMPKEQRNPLERYIPVADQGLAPWMVGR